MPLGLPASLAPAAARLSQDTSLVSTGDVDMKTGRPRKYKDQATARAAAIWHGMVRRCHNETDPSYARYGGRGIVVCERWRADVFAFLEDMGSPPSPEHTLDRINNDGNYEPGNCRWATAAEQARNKSSTLMVKWAGKKIPALEWAERLRLKPYGVYQFLKMGYTPERILEEIAGRSDKTSIRKAGSWRERKSPLAGRKFRDVTCEVCTRRHRVWIGKPDKGCPASRWHPYDSPVAYADAKGMDVWALLRDSAA